MSYILHSVVSICVIVDVNVGFSFEVSFNSFITTGITVDLAELMGESMTKLLAQILENGISLPALISSLNKLWSQGLEPSGYQNIKSFVTLTHH